MPVHDWTSVDAGTFHAFHTAWVTHLSESLNGGLLPPGYYALPEQHFGRSIADVLTPHSDSPADRTAPGEGGLLLAEAPPLAGKKLTVSPAAGARRRTLAIRHVSGNRLVAVLEIVSPANKDRPRHVDDFATKAAGALTHGVHLLVADLFPPGPHDPAGMHAAIWRLLDDQSESKEQPPPDARVLAAYLSRPEVEAWVEFVKFADALPDMPLFLSEDRYVNVLLERTYQMAFKGLPGHVQADLGV